MTTLVRRTSMVLGLATVLLLGGCHSESQAEPPAFPDIESYTPVQIADYNMPITTPGRRPFDAYFFSTPDGITCAFDSHGAGCTGNNFPGVAPASSSPGVVNSISTYAGMKPTNDPISEATSPPRRVLPPFQSITVDGAICGVDDAGTTACKDSRGRGFILSPAWTGWLPQV